LQGEKKFHPPPKANRGEYHKNMEEQRWWHMYGAFPEGEDDMPHMGQVLKHHMKMCGLKADTLAERLGQHGWDIGERRVKQMLSDNNAAEPQGISRRRLLSKLLNIPPALLGLSLLGNDTVHLEQLIPTSSRPDTELMAQTELALSSFWENFYSSSVHPFDDGIIHWRNLLAEQARQSEQTRTLLCRFDQLVAVSAKDRSDYATAMFFHNESVELARELNNPEMLASSLIRRAKTEMYLDKHAQAANDVNEAVKAAHRSRDNLRGYIYQFTGQFITMYPNSRDATAKFQQFMAEASKLLAKGRIEDDRSFVRFNLAGYQQDSARGYLRLGQADAALDAIEAAEQLQDATTARWHTEMLIIRGEAYLQNKELEFASHQLQEAIKLIKTVTHSGSQRKKAEGLLRQIVRQYPRHPETFHLRALLDGAS
jgi:tetratricopeptide (TPR) repeat protein